MLPGGWILCPAVSRNLEIAPLFLRFRSLQAAKPSRQFNISHLIIGYLMKTIFREHTKFDRIKQNSIK
jgi:hypothetical protein